MEDMIHHTAAVVRGTKNAFVVADMPFMSYQTSVYDAVLNAGRLIKEGGANAVKLEGGAEVCEQIKAIVSFNAKTQAGNRHTGNEKTRRGANHEKGDYSPQGFSFGRCYVSIQCKPKGNK